MISIIILTYNEGETIQTLLGNLQQLSQTHGKEIIVADGGSSDETISAVNNQARIIFSKTGKAFQMNKAAKAAWGDILFFVHADMHFPMNTLLAIEEAVYKEKVDGGGFSNIFDQHNDKIKQIGNIMNLRIFDKREQSDKGIFYGDNALFIKKSVFESLGGFKEIPIMEDYEFSKRASKIFNLKKLKNPIITVSARRHIKTGFIKTRFLWIVIRQLYKMGCSPFVLAKWYAHVR